jgi:hypothetical protein
MNPMGTNHFRILSDYDPLDCIKGPKDRTISLFVWLVVVANRKVLLVGCSWLICFERKVLLGRYLPEKKDRKNYFLIKFTDTEKHQLLKVGERRKQRRRSEKEGSKESRVKATVPSKLY